MMTSAVQLFCFCVCILWSQVVEGFSRNRLNFAHFARLHALRSDKVDCVQVDLGDRSYPIYIGDDILNDYQLFQNHVSAKKALIVTNTVVGPLYLERMRESLKRAGIEDVVEVILPDGEEYKRMDVLMTILDSAMEARLDRKSFMIALGGGVIGDMCGFAAAIYQRGIRFVQIPTTLMAMVDSSVGGKTAVNHPGGKNMIGAFYQPEAVMIDTSTLNSLPDRELRSGIAEVIKYGLIKDPLLFAWLEENISAVLTRDPAALAYIIRRSCEIKARVVALDEKESGERAKLNLGHTFGHAIETGLGYGCWLHGEAVAAGMAMAANVSANMHLIDRVVAERTVALLRKSLLPTRIDDNFDAVAGVGGEAEYQSRLQQLTTERFLELMSMDKKVADGQLSLILLQGPLGNCSITNQFDSSILRQTVEDYCLKVMNQQ